MTQKTKILASARVAELRTTAEELAALCKRRAPIELVHQPPSTARRRLLALLLQERRRNAKLIELLNG